MKKFLLLLIMLSIQKISSQEVNGIIYDSEGIVSEFEVINKTRQTYSRTNEQGLFKITSSIGDTLIFQSMIYQKQTHIVQEKDMEETIIIELKNSVNSLDQVNLSSATKEFDLKKENKEFVNLIEKDRKENTYQYVVPESKGNIYKGLVSMIKNMFPAEPEVQVIKLEDYQNLFSTEETPNYVFLNKELNIPEEQYNLFFDYLESKALSYELLEASNRLDLIQKLYNLSDEYRLMLKSAKDLN